MAIACRECGGTVKANKSKLGIVLGGTAATMLVGAMTATPVGWIGLIPALWAGSANATRMLHMKHKLMTESERAGGYFKCSVCQRDVPLGEVFGS